MHACVSSVAPHGVPPKCGSEVISRTRLREPLPHDAEHSPKTDHWVMTHPVEQYAVPQARRCESGGQVLPPCMNGRFTERVRVCVPGFKAA